MINANRIRNKDGGYTPVTREERDELLKDAVDSLLRIAEALEDISAQLDEGCISVVMPGVERAINDLSTCV